MWVVFSSVLRKFPPAGTLRPVQVYFWLGFFSLVLFFNNGSSMDKPTERDTGFWSLSPPQFLRAVGHPTTNRKRKHWAFGASVRFASLSLPVLTIEAAATSTALAGHASSVPSCLHQPPPSLFSPPQPPPRAATAGLPARPLGHLVTRSKPSLGCYEKIPGSSGEQQEFAGPEKRLEMNCVCAKKPWI